VRQLAGAALLPWQVVLAAVATLVGIVTGLALVLMLLLASFVLLHVGQAFGS